MGNQTDEHQPRTGLPMFAFIWAATALIHQLSFSFWVEFWPGWILVFSAIAVIGRPTCLFRFFLLIAASLTNLWNKMPFVPNHILFEGMLHVIMLLALLTQAHARDAITANLPRLKWFVVALGLKFIWWLTPLSDDPISGVLTSLLIFASFGLALKKTPTVGAKFGEPFFEQIAPILRWALVIMYFWAAIQKMNWDYLNPDVSCAARLHTEIASYFPFIPTERWALVGAIYGSFFFEIAIPILLLIRRTRRFAFPVAIVFHLWLAIHPAAGIYSFSSLILAMLVLFLPKPDQESLSSLWQRQAKWLGRGDLEQGQLWAHRIVIAAFFVTMLIQASMYLSVERSFAVFLKANRIGFATFMIWGLWLCACYLIALWNSRHKSPEVSGHLHWSIPALGLALVISNGMNPWLGLKTQTSFSMYSNLRTEGNANHLFLKRWDLFNYQREVVTIIKSEPIDILGPTSKPRGIEQFAHPGLKTLTRFELRRLLSRLPKNQDIELELQYEMGPFEGEVISADGHLSRIDGVVKTDEILFDPTPLFEPIPLLQRKFLWFRRLSSLEGPMECTH